jgi:sugar phosphate isomerase/epimerase
MRCGIAIWNYAEPGVGLLELVQEFVSFGYDAVSFLPSQIASLDDEQLRRLASLVGQEGLLVTVHGNFEMSAREAERLLHALGDSLYAISFDPAVSGDPRSFSYDTARMVPFVRKVLDMSAGTDLRVAIEDFPLEDGALEAYRADLEPLLGEARYGILVDIGHMNLRLRKGGHYAGVTVAEYLQRLPLPLVEVHVHDNRGERDDHGHLGFGEVRFGEVAAGLKGIGFQGVTTIEIAPSFHGSSPAESKPHARRSLATWCDLWAAA